MKQNAGTFYASAQLVQENTDYFCEIMSLIKFIATSVEYEPFRDQYKYTGYSAQFDELAPGIMFPEYNLQIEKDANGEIESVKVVRLEHEHGSIDKILSCWQDNKA